MANDALTELKRQHDARTLEFTHVPLGDAETERAAVRCALLEPSLFSNHLDARHFSCDSEAGMVWAAGAEILRAGRPVNEWTINDALENMGVEYPATFLSHLTDVYTPPGGFEGYAKILRAWAEYRSLVGLWAKVQNLPADGSAPDMATMFDAIQTEMERLRSDRVATSDRFHLYTAADALAPQPPVAWAVEQLLMPGSVNMIYGPPGVGKTFATLDLAVCFALGVPWADLKLMGGPVLIVDEESGKRRLAERLGKCLRGHYADEKLPIHYVTMAGCDLRGAADQAALRDLVERTGARLVLIDALVDVALGADENSVKDMIPVLHGLRQTVDATGATALLIHHPNRAGSYRGSSAIAGALDAILEFDKASGTQALWDLRTEKQRDGEPINLRLMLRWDGDMFDVKRAPDAPKAETFSKAESYVLRVLADGPMKKVDIEAGADSCSEDAARKAVYSLTNRGKIKRIDKGGSGSVATYALADPE